MRQLHNWDLSYSQARQLQAELAPKIQHTALNRPPRSVAGIDCAFSKDGNRIYAAVVVLTLPELALIETAHADQPTRFPYIPGLLSFREAPVCLAAVEKLKSLPELFIVDGQGIAHPRRFGLASHLGLLLDRPTIGCAKSKLTGTFDPPAPQKGSYSPLLDADELIGAVVRTRTNVKPVFVSVGHKCSLKDAIELTLACTSRYRLPEPTRLAHQLVGKLKARYR